ncbi:fatty acid desaturase [bacterium]|jgi:sphingolipid delta-4 desaturase|nr:fatty acid desaturase [bacterium]
MTTSANQYIHVNYPEPHAQRGRDILKAHPEVKKLFGHDPITAAWLALIVGMQILIAAAIAHSSAWWILAVSFFVGAFATHSLFVIIHEATHNLIFRSPTANKIAAIIANLPFVFPAAIGFRKYHLVHHRNQGDLNLDADLAGEKEAKLIGNSTLGKTLWMLGFVFFEGLVRPARVAKMGKVQLWDGWVVFNAVAEVAFVVAVVHFLGWGALGYLAASSLFSVGLHPVGGRWIQEHYVVKHPQETYSYYGPLNNLAFNVGYHNEHHDLTMVAWSNLPKLKAMAPEFYEPLYAHYSWTGLLIRFLTDPKMSLYSRVTRPPREMLLNPMAEANLPQDISSKEEAVPPMPPGFLKPQTAPSASPVAHS